LKTKNKNNVSQTTTSYYEKTEYGNLLNLNSIANNNNNSNNNNLIENNNNNDSSSKNEKNKNLKLDGDNFAPQHTRGLLSPKKNLLKSPTMETTKKKLLTDNNNNNGNEDNDNDSSKYKNNFKNSNQTNTPISFIENLKKSTLIYNNNGFFSLKNINNFFIIILFIYTIILT
jgi:hypothetical protein